MITDTITFLPTQSLSETKQFYVDNLGLTFRLDQGACHIYQTQAGAHFGFCESLSPITPSDQVILTLVTNEVDQFYEQVKEKGIPTDGPPCKNPKFNIYHFFMTDPNGYKVEVQRFLSNW